MSQRKQIAVIGGGLSGLSAAWRLSQDPDVEVVLYETLSSPGFANASFSLESGVDVDVPQRYFVENYYPVLTSLYRHLQVDSVPVTSPTSFLSLAEPERAYFAYHNLVLFGGRLSIPWVNPLRLLEKETRDIIWDVFNFARTCRRDLADQTSTLYRRPDGQPPTIREYLLARGFSAAFRDKLLGPLFAVVCTCTVAEALDYPAAQVAEWYVSTAPKSSRFRASHQRVAGGIRRLVPVFLAKVAHVRCSTRVTAVEPHRDESGRDVVVLHETGPSGDTVVRQFDHVVLAAQPDASLRMLKQPTPLHAQILGCFDSSRSCVTLHRDASVMPRDRRLWNSMNFTLSKDGRHCQATLWQNTVQDLPASEGHIFQTWNPLVDIDPSLVISTSWFDRPVLTPETVRQIAQIDKIQGVGNIWFCGSYAQLGIPLLEGAVASGLQVAGRLTKVPLPFPLTERDFSNKEQSSAVLCTRNILLAGIVFVLFIWKFFLSI